MVLPRPGGGARSQPDQSRPTLGGKGVTGGGGRGLGGKGSGRRHRKIVKDTIRGITKNDIRRLARRGGVKRISGQIYEDVRAAMVDRLTTLLRDCTTYVDHRGAKTVTVTDVIFSLKRMGTPIYGFDKDSYIPTRRNR